MSQLDGTSRFCPVCSKLLGQENHPAGFAIDVCPAGHGSFFDQEEFEEVGSLPMDEAGNASKPVQSTLAENEVTVVPDQVEDSQFNFLSKLKVAFRHSDKPCPRCEGINMVEIKFGVQQLLVDECPKCQGIWLDTGEEAMLEELGRGVQLKFESKGIKSYHSWYSSAGI